MDWLDYKGGHQTDGRTQLRLNKFRGVGGHRTDRQTEKLTQMTLYNVRLDSKIAITITIKHWKISRFTWTNLGWWFVYSLILFNLHRVFNPWINPDILELQNAKWDARQVTLNLQKWYPSVFSVYFFLVI